MPGPSATWDTKRVFITYRNVLSGLLEAGSWTAKINVRVTNTLTDNKRQVFRQGNLGSGPLNTNEAGGPSLAVDLPIVDDPQNTPNGGEITLTVTFASGGQETFKLAPLMSWPTDPGTDLALILDPQLVASAPPINMKGIPGGVAALDAQGYVLNGSGERITGGGTSGGTGGAVNWGNVTDKPAVIAAGSTQAVARTAIAVYSTNEVDQALISKVNTSTFNAALANKADLVNNTVPLNQIPPMPSTRINDFLEAVEDAVAFILQPGTGINISQDDPNGRVVITNTGGGTGGTGSSINDTAASTASTYSSTKINSVVAAIINDAVTVSGTTWSSAKIKNVVDTAVAALVNSAPGSLDTINELAAALGNDPNGLITLTNAVNNRVRFDAAQTLTAGQKQQARNNIDVYGKAEVGSPLTDFTAYYTGARDYREGGGTATNPSTGGSTVAATVTPNV